MRAPLPDGYLARLKELVASDRRGDAVDLFMSRGIGLPGWMVLMMRFLPSRSGQKALAHTLPHDAAISGDATSNGALQYRAKRSAPARRAQTLSSIRPQLRPR